MNDIVRRLVILVKQWRFNVEEEFKSFLTYEDVRQRLHDTICFWDGELVHVTTCHRGSMLIFMKSILGTKYKGYAHDLSKGDGKLDYSAFALGYYDDGSTCAYLSRTPRRQYQGGLGRHTAIREEGRSLPLDYWASAALGRCILGIHTGLSEAVCLINQGREKVAIHRHFCLKSNYGGILLLYREREVGAYSRQIGKFVLHDTSDSSVIMSEFREAGFGEFLL